MSRTDAHRPWWVLQQDPTARHRFVEWHRHIVRQCWDRESRRWLVRRLEPCDLDQALAQGPRRQTRCRLIPSHVLCGCRGCKRKDERKLGQRQQRAVWRMTARRLAAAPDVGGVDVLTPRRRDGW